MRLRSAGVSIEWCQAPEPLLSYRISSYQTSLWGGRKCKTFCKLPPWLLQKKNIPANRDRAVFTWNELIHRVRWRAKANKSVSVALLRYASISTPSEKPPNESVKNSWPRLVGFWKFSRFHRQGFLIAIFSCCATEMQPLCAMAKTSTKLKIQKRVRVNWKNKKQHILPVCKIVLDATEAEWPQNRSRRGLAHIKGSSGNLPAVPQGWGDGSQLGLRCSLVAPLDPKEGKLPHIRWPRSVYFGGVGGASWFFFSFFLFFLSFFFYTLSLIFIPAAFISEPSLIG